MKAEFKSKSLTLLSILTSLMGYLEWGKDNRSFLFQAEAEIISKLFTDPISAIHPFTILPLAGQLVLFLTLFQKRPNATLTFIGLSGIGILLAFMFVTGLVSLNYKISFSTIPFLVVGFLTFRHYRRMKRLASQSVSVNQDK